MNFLKNILMIALMTSSIVACSIKKDTPPSEPPKPTPKELSTSLFESTLKSDYDSVRKLIEDGADLNVYDVDGYTPLMRAVQIPNNIMAGILIKGGAKIYLPSKDDSSVTALSSINENDVEMNRIFDAEKKRLFSILEKNINDGVYDDALKFSQENYIPLGTVLPASNKLELELALEKATSPEDKALLEYLIKNYKKETLEDLSEKTLNASAKMKSKGFLDFLILNYPVSEENKVFNTFVAEDASDTDWLIAKIEILNQYSYELKLDAVSDHFLAYNSSITPSDANKEKFLRLLSAVLKSNSNTANRNHFMQSALNSAAKNSKQDVSYLNWIVPAIRIWEATDLPDTGFAFDDTSFYIIKSLEGRSFDESFIGSIFNSVVKFAPSLDNDSERSIKAIITGDFRDAQKVELLDLIIAKTKTLPKDVIAFAIETKGIETLQMLLSAEIPFEQSNQTKAVLAAIESTKSGDTAYQLLKLLKEHGFVFNTEEGAKASIMAFEKFAVKKDDTYEAPLDFLLSTSPSPIEVLNKEQALKMLKDTLKTARSSQRGWKLLNKIIEKVNTEDFSGSEVYQRQLDISADEPAQTVTISFTWDYILTMYEFHKAGTVELDAMMLLFDTVLKKFPKDTYSMGLGVRNLGPYSYEQITENILPLSLLFTMDKVKLSNSLKTTNVNSFKTTIRYRPFRMSWADFAEGDVHYYYFQEKEFWERVSRVLVRGDKQIKAPSDRSTVEFMKILVNSGMLDKFPKLSDKMGSFKVSLPDDDKRCVLPAKEQLVSEDPLTKLQQLGKATIDYMKPWTSLGSFEALMSLKAKSCSGEKLSSKEVKFISDYIPLNIGSRNSYNIGSGIVNNSVQGREILCNRIKKPFGANYTYMYDFMGHSIKNEDKQETPNSYLNPEISTYLLMARKCHEFSHSAKTHYYAKTDFLSDWYNCSAEHEDTALNRVFERISENHSIYPRASDSNIKLCYYN